uniref:Uncharacterized protein n=1 Tax=viral metagenome TaxID=1070528 RepID=A0A6C0JT10_9ZZZZ
MASNTMTQNIISNFQFFKQRIDQERKNDPSHFLWIGGITEDFFSIDSVDAVDGNWSCSRATRYMLQAAIHEFYHEFNRKLYESFDNPNGLFTKVIWGKFRTLQKAWNVLHQAKMVADGRAQKAIESANRARGHLKRQANEKQQMLNLGGGDLSLGRKKFEERMHVQKAVKLNKVNDVSLQMEEDFAAWLLSPEFAASYTKPMVDGAVKQFCTIEFYGQNYKLTTTNLKVNGFSGMLDALRQLVNHPSASDLHITTNLEWDEKVPFSNPHAHTYPAGGSTLRLNNSGRVEQRQKVHVQGFIEKDGKSYIVTPRHSNAYCLFPKKFEKLESRNPRVSSRMTILYNVDLCVSHLTVTRMSGNVKHLMNISIMHNGIDTVDATTIFQSHIVRKLKTVSDNALTHKRKEKELHDRQARHKGIVISNRKHRNVAWLDECKYGYVDKAIRDGHVTVRPSTAPPVHKMVDTTDQIMKLCDMFEKGFLTDEQFEAAKTKALE